MRIVLTTPDGMTKTDLITTRRELAAIKPEVTWPRDIDQVTQEMLDDNGVVGKISTETPPPAIDTSIQALDSDDARQPNGEWIQTWEVVDKYTLVEAKAEFAVNAIAVYQTRIMQEQWTTAEMTTHAAEPVPITAARVAKFKPILSQARTALQAATTLEEIGEIWDQYLAAMA